MDLTLDIPEYVDKYGDKNVDEDKVNENKNFQWSNYSGLPMVSIMEIAETYFVENKNLLESNDRHSIEYFNSLFDLSESPKVGNNYLLTMLILVNNKIIVGENPVQIQVVKHLKDNEYSVRMPSGEIKVFPHDIIRDRAAYHTFFFSNESQYKKLQTALKIKFDTDLPNS